MIVIVIIIIIIRSASKHRHACFRRAVSQSPKCRLQGTVVSIIIVFVLDFFVFVLVLVNENHTALTLTLNRVILHTVMHHSSTCASVHCAMTSLLQLTRSSHVDQLKAHATETLAIAATVNIA